ncbi:recombinase family protein [Rhodopirellula sp. MGV]|uniref:recombinase family protein n=1 Tax=Rhodopirellula sp. MGV TaxID=2023130 RepID=UPI000B96528B|nr:recombinase family protein [Rhodopirellula sp. MGV]OYP28468.1 resolvase [Rhodopirellula sp. MGV]PNY38654.1 recombinase family protein [Rhodopirellula baltica]
MPQSDHHNHQASIACYIRVSTSSQNSDAQRTGIERWLRGHGLGSTTVRWFEDKETGRDLLRPAFTALQESIFIGDIKTVIVWRLDRLSRSQKDGINTLADWCDKGVRVVSVTQQLDLSGATGRLIAGVLFAVAEMELEAIKERQAMGIAAAKAKGVYKCNGERRRGYRKADRDKVLRLRDQGRTVTSIARELGIGRTTVYSYLKESDPR